MAKAAIARIEGDDYQARFFWFQVCRMFYPNTNVTSVSYEWDEIKGFDDVVVAFDPPIPDDREGMTYIDYFQIKFHVSQDGSITWRALMEPGFIGATSVSVLQRLQAAVYHSAERKKDCRFILVTPWHIGDGDVLAHLVSNNAGELRLDRLFDGSGPRSTIGQIRGAWAAHLCIDESQLAEVLRPFRIYAGWGSLSDLNERLNDKLYRAGLKPSSEGSRFSPYDDLIRKLIRAGKTTFTADEIIEICEREGLWVGTLVSDTGTDIGIRSFIRYAEHMEDETEYMLDLVPHFSGRKIQSPPLWSEAILPKVATFLGQVVTSSDEYRLHLDTHTSVAFAAGYYLETKAGVRVVPVQKTMSGKQVWTPGVMPQMQSRWSLYADERHLDLRDLAVGVSVTHDVSRDVEEYLSRAMISVREFLHFRVSPSPSNTAIESGSQALALVQDLVARIRERRTPAHPDQIVHLFIAAPNAFTFFLGQHGHALGRCAIYEYDFNSGALGAYEPSVRFPENMLAGS